MISVIVLSKNNDDTLDKCLKSIIESDGEKEIIVVDAHSTDDTPQNRRCDLPYFPYFLFDFLFFSNFTIFNWPFRNWRTRLKNVS